VGAILAVTLAAALYTTALPPGAIVR
jgi:hypothetical protein